MNAEIKKEWIEALRSGVYLQGKSALKRNGGYCCLGVLCELAVNAGVIPKPAEGTFGRVFDNSAIYLPLSVQKWAGIDAAGQYTKPGYTDKQFLANDNDNGLSFNKIADIIEQFL